MCIRDSCTPVADLTCESAEANGKLTVSWSLPESGCCEEIRIADREGQSLASLDGQTTSHEIACAELPPAVAGSHRITVSCVSASGRERSVSCEFECENRGLQVPFDCNQDQVFNMSDPVCLLGHFFLANPITLPCEPGGRRALFDWNGDSLHNLSDAVAALNHLFLAGPPHELGVGVCTPIGGCPSICGG